VAQCIYRRHQDGPEERLQILARLHHGIVSLHPFLDYDGRMAQLLTDQAAPKLLGERIAVDLTTDRYLVPFARQMMGASKSLSI
jgi:fido (protein-threonine AMPylation protein)